MLGKDRQRWTPPEPDFVGAEAEWGYEPELDRDIEALVARHGLSQHKIREYVARSGPFDEIRMMLFSNGTPALGQGSIDSWRSILAEARKTGSFLGVDERAYPSDFATLRRYHTALKALEPHLPLTAPLERAHFEEALRRSDALSFEPGGEVETPGPAKRRYA